MKVLKIFFSIVVLFLGNTGIAQSPAIIKYATSAVERLNDRITSINPNVPLTPDQVKIITDLQIANFVKIQAIKAAYSQDIKTTVLSKTQLTAFNKGWKSMQATKK